MPTVNRDGCLLPLSPAFVDILDRELQHHTALHDNASSIEASTDSVQGYILNFRDPEYSAETGGFHPVEVLISSAGVIGYITDFAYVGCPPYAELAKELDFDFTYQLFGFRGMDYPLAEGGELFEIFQHNFISYYHSGVFQLTVSTY